MGVVFENNLKFPNFTGECILHSLWTNFLETELQIAKTAPPVPPAQVPEIICFSSSNTGPKYLKKGFP